MEITPERLRQLYRKLKAAGQNYGIRPAGNIAEEQRQLERKIARARIMPIK